MSAAAIPPSLAGTLRRCGGAGVMVAAMLLLVACGSGISGTFEDEMGMSRLTFHRDGRVVQGSELVGVEVEMKYEVDGDRIRVSHPEADGTTLVLTRIDDDTLSGPMGFRFKRTK